MKLFVRRRDTEALLDGRPLGDDAGLGDVEAFLCDMRAELCAMPAPAPRPTLAATLDGRRPLRPAAGPTVKPTFPPARPRSRRLRPAVVAFATSAALFGTLATAGALPRPAQRATAELGSHLGIHLPGEETIPSAPGHRVEPGTTRTDSPGSQAPSSRPGTNPTTVTGSSPTTVPIPGSSVLPTTPTTAAAGVSPSLPTTPTLPQLPWPKAPVENPLEGLIGRSMHVAGLGTVSSP